MKFLISRSRENRLKATIVLSSGRSYCCSGVWERMSSDRQLTRWWVRWRRNTCL